MKVYELYDAINDIAPFEGGFSWDNSGLICGDKNADVTRVLVTLDADMAAYRKAVETGADAVVSHHPLIFDPLHAVTAEHPVFHFVKSGIAVISAHTCLDAAQNGVSQALAEACGLQNIECMYEEGVAIGRMGVSDLSEPEAFIERVKGALPSARCDAVISRDVKRVMCVGGSGGGELYAAVSHGCDTVVTGEIKYNNIIDARNMGVNLFAFGHFETENIVLQRVGAHLDSRGFDVFVFAENSPYERR